ncbi:MAG TPA: helix-turn-helix domain-containing protein [Candidatus Mediterraneibacter cottocaccae]|nr:helix-turn-helix domain-containing protein [Candidatus Mediterraneibacter cottocaccae]
MGEVRFMISEAAKQVHVESHVLRYWEEELGLTIGRTEMGHRYYTEDDIQLFRCIKKLKDEGMLLKDLKPLIPELKETRLKLKESSKDAKSAPEQSAPKSNTVPGASAVPEPAASSEVVIPLRQLDQVKAIIGEVVSEVVTGNNEVLKKDISSAVTADVMKEMDFLLQAKERQQEEHFRKLDCLIRQQQASRRETVKGSPIMKLRKIFS